MSNIMGKLQISCVKWLLNKVHRNIAILH